jgi:hypothetical protein
MAPGVSPAQPGSAQPGPGAAIANFASGLEGFDALLIRVEPCGSQGRQGSLNLAVQSCSPPSIQRTTTTIKENE